MTLIKSQMNQHLSNSPYSDKRSVYQQSQILLTKKLFEEHLDWTPARINERQCWLADQAAAIWRINELS